MNAPQTFLGLVKELATFFRLCALPDIHILSSSEIVISCMGNIVNMNMSSQVEVKQNNFKSSNILSFSGDLKLFKV